MMGVVACNFGGYTRVLQGRSMDIRGFFGKASKQPLRNKDIIIIEDDENDFKSPVKISRKHKRKRRNVSRVLYDSDNEEKETTEKKKVSQATPPGSKARKELSSVDEFFDVAPITRSKLPKKSDTKPSHKPHPPPDPSHIPLQEDKLPPAKKLKLSTNRSVTPPSINTSTSPASGQPVPPSRGNSYQDYLNREGPKALGSKLIPDGADNCLSGLTFVFTGVGESLERDEASELAKKYGGRVTTNISGKTDYVVTGEGAGESKLKKARDLKTKLINEDEFINLIRTCPRKKGGATTPTTPASKSSRKRKSTSTTPTVPMTNILTTPTSTKREVKPLLATPSTSECVAMVTTPTRKSSQPKSPSTLLWADKYSPATCKQIIGQQGKKSNVYKLIDWLRKWYQYHGTSSTSAKKPTGEGSGFKAALLSGPPGVGKTTSAILVCKEIGYSYTELNASAARSKKSLQKLVTDSVSSHSLDSFLTGGLSGQQHVFIMDEVDGMAGNEDRGGIQELIELIKASRIPIICICNDRHHTKIRSLVNYCFDLKFNRPKLEQIKGPMMSVAYKEGIKVSPQVMQEIIVASNHDVRQVLHNLSMLSAAQSANPEAFKESVNASAKTSIRMSPFDVVKKVFLPFDGERELSLREKSDLFFSDYSFIPLFVQENYVRVKPTVISSRVHLLQQTSAAADSIACGDLVSRSIQTDNAWNLLPTQAMFSSVFPGEYMRGSIGRPEFPHWLGNNSKRLKNDRLLQQLQQHTRLSCSCNKTEFLLNYSQFLSSKLTRPLIDQGTEGVNEVVNTLRHYDLTREDWDNLVELVQFSGRNPILAKLDSKVKSAFTRCYNKADIKLPYAVERVVKKRGRLSEEEDASSSGEESEDPSRFAVKVLKGNGARAGTSKGKRQRGKK